MALVKLLAQLPNLIRVMKYTYVELRMFIGADALRAKVCDTSN